MRCWGNESPCRRGLHHGGGDPRDGFARQVSNEVVFLEKGLLIEKAPPEKFFTQPDSERVRQFLQSSR